MNDFPDKLSDKDAKKLIGEADKKLNQSKSFAQVDNTDPINWFKIRSGKVANIIGGTLFAIAIYIVVAVILYLTGKYVTMFFGLK